MKERLRRLLGQGQTSQVIRELLEATRNLDELQKEVILQSVRFENYSKDKRSGSSAYEEESVLFSKINNALLEIIDQLPDGVQHGRYKFPQRVTRLAMLAALFVGAGLGLWYLLGHKPIDSFSVTVLVHGKEGRDDRILRSQGKVVLDIGSARHEASINEKGEATFKELPGGFAGKKAFLSIEHPQPYFPIDRNSEYVLEDGSSIYLEVELTGIDRIFGRVLDFETEKPLDSVRVSVQNEAAYTDEYGWFELSLPPEMQAKFLNVTFFRKNYQIARIDSIAPHTRQEIGILLKRTEK